MSGALSLEEIFGRVESNSFVFFSDQRMPKYIRVIILKMALEAKYISALSIRTLSKKLKDETRDLWLEPMQKIIYRRAEAWRYIDHMDTMMMNYLPFEQRKSIYLNPEIIGLHAEELLCEAFSKDEDYLRYGNTVLKHIIDHSVGEENRQITICKILEKGFKSFCHHVLNSEAVAGPERTLKKISEKWHKNEKEKSDSGPISQGGLDIRLIICGMAQISYIRKWKGNFIRWVGENENLAKETFIWLGKIAPSKVVYLLEVIKFGDPVVFEKYKKSWLCKNQPEQASDQNDNRKRSAKREDSSRPKKKIKVKDNINPFDLLV